ncbi:MAG: energy transducer TonB [Bacteroidales bacterium]|nr:energy transducer TonB [Bacteroidales bacterium]
MRILKSIAFAFLLASASTVTAQVVTPPQYPGGDYSFAGFLFGNLRYPDVDSAISGRVYVRITIDTDGTVVNPRVVKSLGAEFDNEALRLVNIMPRWEPARDESGNPIVVTSAIPIPFFAPKEKERMLLDSNYTNAKPVFPGGKEGWTAYFKEQLERMNVTQPNCGDIQLFLSVESDGRLTNIKYPEDLDERCLTIIKTIMDNMPRWIPSADKGVPSRSSIGFSVNIDEITRQ